MTRHPGDTDFPDTLFQGLTAGDIAMDDRITNANQINAGYKLAAGDNTLALDMVNLQFSKVSSNQFTIGEAYQNIISGVGTDVQQAENLFESAGRLLLFALRGGEKLRVSTTRPYVPSSPSASPAMAASRTTARRPPAKL